MYLIASLLVAFVVTLFLLSKIAGMLHAKEPGMGRIFLASIVGSIAATVVLVPLGLFGQGIDPIIILLISVLIVFLVSSMAFKYINVMSWGGAITTNIASIVLSLISLTAAVVLTGGSIGKTISAVNSAMKENAGMVAGMASGDYSSMSQNTDQAADVMEGDSVNNEASEEVALEDDYEPTFKEKDLLPEATIKELEAKEKKVYVEPKYHVVSIASIRSVVGKNIRILNKNDKSITGLLKTVRGNDAVVEQRLNGGLATTPISLAKIRKLEVYR